MRASVCWRAVSLLPGCLRKPGWRRRNRSQEKRRAKISSGCELVATAASAVESQKVADDKGIHRAVQLLQHIARTDGQGKTNGLWKGWTPGSCRCALPVGDKAERPPRPPAAAAFFEGSIATLPGNVHSGAAVFGGRAGMLARKDAAHIFCALNPAPTKKSKRAMRAELRRAQTEKAPCSRKSCGALSHKARVSRLCGSGVGHLDQVPSMTSELRMLIFR